MAAKDLAEYSIGKLALAKLKDNDKQPWWPVIVEAYDTESMVLIVKYMHKNNTK